MIIPETAVTLKDGTKVILRSPQPRDAAQLNEYLRLTSGETHYMVRYPEECDQTLESGAKAPAGDGRTMREASCSPRFWMASWSETAASTPCRTISRCATAPVLGISIKKKAWGLGLGTLLMEKALEQAKENGFTQVELGVFADNDRARYLYRNLLGFTEMGCIPKAFCLKDGTYRDEVQMVKFLTD